MIKIIMILGISFGVLRSQAQVLHIAANTNFTVIDTGSINGSKTTAPSVYVDGDVVNNGTITNNGEVQYNGNLTNNGTYSSAGDDVFIQTDAQALNGNFLGANKFYNLVLDKGDSSLNLTAMIDVANAIVFNGGVIRGNGFRTQLLNTSTTAVQSSASSGSKTDFIDGMLRQNIAQGNYSFFVGDSVHGLQKVSVNFANTGGATYMDVSYTSVGAGSANVPGCNVIYDKQSGTWNLSPNGTNATYDYSIKLEAGGANLAAYSSGLFDGVIKGGFFITNPCDRFNGNDSVGGLNSFSAFKKVSTANASLPIELLSFIGGQDGAFDKLNWVTTTERNNDFFTVLRSPDGVSFEAIGTVKTKSINGNSGSELSYEFINKQPFIGHNYYRLEQVDVDGNKNYSNIIDLIRKDKGKVSLYPNPTKDKLNIDFSTNKVSLIELRLFDLSGRVVKSILSKSHKGMNHLEVSLSHLANGIYHIQLLENNLFIYQGKVRKE